jgi:hypothetical protein
MWSDTTSKQWKRSEDEMESTKILLGEAQTPGVHGVYTVEPIPLQDEPGFKAITFSLPEILRKYRGCI